MKKIFFVLEFIMCMNIYSFPFSLHLHESVDFKSAENLYYLSEKDLSKFSKYKLQDAFIFCIADSYSNIDGEDKKNNLVIGNLRIHVLSERNTFEYKINGIKVITQKDEYDMADILYLPYPYEKPLKTEFELDKVITDYYSSWYYLGYFKFPEKNNANVIIKLSIEVDSHEYVFEYPYAIKKHSSFINFND